MGEVLKEGICHYEGLCNVQIGSSIEMLVAIIFGCCLVRMYHSYMDAANVGGGRIHQELSKRTLS